MKARLRFLLAPVVAFSLSACSSRAGAATYLLDVDSSAQQSGTFGYFTTGRAWDLKFSWDCSRQLSERMSDVNRFAITTLFADDGSASAEHPPLSLHGRKGGSTLHFHRQGIYSVLINSPCDWRAQVIDKSVGGG